MTEILATDLGFVQAMSLAVILSAIPLLSSLIVGLVVSILQAATQIQEQTLTFVPKVAVVVLVLLFAGEWMSGELVNYYSQLLESLPSLAMTN